MKCANPACRIERKTHLWVVNNIAYCSPWCERNWNKHPNTVGTYKVVWNALRKRS